VYKKVTKNDPEGKVYRIYLQLWDTAGQERYLKAFLAPTFYVLYIFAFYVRKELLLSARLSHHNSVHPSVRLSHRWISQKHCKLGSPNLHRRMPGRL